MLTAWCVEHVEDEPWALPVLIGLDCGLRRGEILAVKSTMIDEGTNRLRVTTGISALSDVLGDIHWTPHTLRHTFATRLLAQNVAPQTVSGLLGHESTAFTLARYSHRVDSDLPLLTSQVTNALGA